MNQEKQKNSEELAELLKKMDKSQLLQVTVYAHGVYAGAKAEREKSA